jgi:hypothetical protein
VSDKYVLDENKKAVPVSDTIEWAKGFDIQNRRVAETNIGDIRVSTVFLGLDHSWGKGPPLLFETMAFGGHGEIYCDRYTTWEEAEAGHKAVVAKLERGEKL